MTPRRVLWPVAESRTLRRTAAYLVDEVLEPDGVATVDIVYVPPLQTPTGGVDRERDRAESLLAHARFWIEEDTEAAGREVEIETRILGHEAPLYSPVDVAELLLEEIDRLDVDTVLFDPGYHVGIRTDVLDPLEAILREDSTATVLEAPVAPAVRRQRLPTRADLRRYGLIFGVSFGFYLLLAGTSAYALATGVVAASLVTAVLGSVALWQPPAVRYLPGRVLRWMVYLPYLFVVIVRANFQLARIIFHPSLPIEPKVVRYHPALPGAFPFTTLANSITLTPGTLSMRVVGNDLLVHTLTQAARDDLVDGRLERAVRFIFFGRGGMRIASPTERGDATEIDQPGVAD